MANILSQGSYFIGLIKLKTDAPTYSRGDTVEISIPYRSSSCHIIRLWREFGVLFGKWVPTDWDEELALENAIGWKRHADLDDEVATWGQEDDEL